MRIPKPALILALLAGALGANLLALGSKPAQLDDLADQLHAFGYDVKSAELLSAGRTWTVLGPRSDLRFLSESPAVGEVHVSAVRPFAFLDWQIREVRTAPPLH